MANLLCRGYLLMRFITLKYMNSKLWFKWVWIFSPQPWTVSIIIVIAIVRHIF